MSIDSVDEKTLSLVRSLAVADQSMMMEKLSFIISSGNGIIPSDIESFNSYNEILHAFNCEIPENIKQTVLDHFAQKNDPDALKARINSLIKEGDEENAVKLIDSMNPDPVSKSIFLSKLAWKKGDYEKEIGRASCRVRV